ncbi:MAG: hypothetical protein ACLFVU_09870 [Phycisphaerae bacterium]
MITFDCDHCGSKLRVPDTKAGKKGKCPGCQAIIHVPSADTGSSQPHQQQPSQQATRQQANRSPVSATGSTQPAQPQQPKQSISPAQHEDGFGLGSFLQEEQSQQASPQPSQPAGSAWGPPPAGVPQQPQANRQQSAHPQPPQATVAPAVYPQATNVNVPERTQGGSVGGFVLCLLAFLLPCLLVISQIMAVIGIVMCSNALKDPYRKRGLSIAGLVLGLLHLLWTVGFLINIGINGVPTFHDFESETEQRERMRRRSYHTNDGFGVNEVRLVPREEGFRIHHGNQPG